MRTTVLMQVADQRLELGKPEVPVIARDRCQACTGGFCHLCKERGEGATCISIHP